MSALAPLKHLVHQCCGLHLEGLAEARLFRAVAALQASTGLTHTSSLVERLTSDRMLFDGFISQLTVNETYFCREPDALNWLVNTHLPQRLAAGKAPLSIFSAGCSSGEEPYSVAMMLYERFGEYAKTLFNISAGDLDHQVLAKARQGIYGGMAFRALSPALKERYFTPHEGRFKLQDSLRQWVNFRPFNLLNAQESSLKGSFDVILFRNVSIYFDEQTRRRIHQQLSPLLAPKGVLLCGVTETLGNDLGVLELVEAQGVFYFQHPEQTTQPSADLPTVSLPPNANSSENIASAEGIAREKDYSTDAASKMRVSLSALPPEEEAEQFNLQLHHAQQLLNKNAFADADELLQALLQQQPWSIDALVLAGLVARWQHRPHVAYEHFKTAIYVAPECWPAHFYLAELYRQGELTDEPIQRQRSYASVVRLLIASPTANGGLDIIAPPIPPGDARFLAERYLSVVNSALESTNTSQGVR